MLQKTSLVTVVITMSLAACGGGGGSDSAVSANPPAPAPGTTPAPAPSPGLDQTPISAPSPAPGKVPTQPVLPAPTGQQFSGAVIRQALKQSIPVIGKTGGVAETGQYVHDGLDNPLAGYIASDGDTIRSRTLSRNEAGYASSREVAIKLTESNGGLLPTVNGTPYAAGDPALDYAPNYPAGSVARTWHPSPGSPYFVKLIPGTLDTHPGALRLCWHINNAAASRLVCSHHGADGSVFGADFFEDISGPPVPHFSWQWQATPRADGQSYALADYAPGAIGGIPARNMTCITQVFGPGSPAPETSVRPVSMTPSEVRVGDQVLLRHGTLESTTSQAGNVVTHTHTDRNPVAVISRRYELRLGELLKVTWGAQAGSSGSTTECAP